MLSLSTSLLLFLTTSTNMIDGVSVMSQAGMSSLEGGGHTKVVLGALGLECSPECTCQEYRGNALAMEALCRNRRKSLPRSRIRRASYAVAAARTGESKKKVHPRFSSPWRKGRFLSLGPQVVEGRCSLVGKLQM